MFRAALRALPLLLLTVAVGGMGTSCGPSSQARPGGAPGIVLVCFDTLRADLALDGSVPALTEFARGGVEFTDACSAASWTLPSVATLMTGLLPSRHGLVGSSNPGRLVPSFRTLAEVLSEAGWHTAASTGGGWICPDQGFHQGFGSFDVGLDRRGMQRAREWLASRPSDRPFFLYLHTFAAHDPYGEKGDFFRGTCRPGTSHDGLARDLSRALDAPGGSVPPDLYDAFMRVRLGDPCGRYDLERRLGPVRMHALYQATPAWADGGYRAASDGGRAAEAHARDAYRWGLPYVDATLRDVLGHLDAADLPEDTVVLVVGDHGESLGEAGALYHGQRLHDAVVRVPLVLRAPGRVPAGVRVSGTCGLVDVFATVLDLAGLPVPPDQDGRSLLPMARAKATGHPVVSETERIALLGGRDVRLLSVRDEATVWLLHYDAATGVLLEESVHDRRCDPDLADPLPLSRLAECPEALRRAVCRARSELAERFGWPPSPAGCH